MSKNNMISLEDISFDNQQFWAYFLSVNYPCAYLEEYESTMYDIIKEALPIDLEWSDKFTQYYDGVIEESDGYIDNPTTLIATLEPLETLKIEFHPGDTIFYINDNEIGCTGPHYKVRAVPYQKVESLLCQDNGELLFQLLLPMAVLETDNISDVKTIIKEQLLRIGIMQPSLSKVIECLITGITK